MRSAVIVDAVRSPIGRRNGILKGWHPVDLSGHVIRALLDRVGVEGGQVDDVIWGCVSQTGEQTGNIGRFAGLAAGLPDEIPGVAIDRQCGSSQQAVHFAAQAIMAGAQDIVVAGGVESMSRIPMGITYSQGPGQAFGPMVMDRYDGRLVPQGISAEMMAEKWGVSRTRLDEISTDSHARAARAIDEGRFATQIVPVEVKDEETGETVTADTDQGVRRGTTVETLAGLKPAFKEDGLITAGNSSQISDGAAALLVVGEDVAEKMGWTPMARVTHFSVVGSDPVLMLDAPIPATFKVLERAGLGIDDMGVIELNEAFSSVVAAWLIETGADWEKVNPNGGAIALGHPLGASGAILMTRLVHEMARVGARYGLQSMCEGGGTANGTILELV
ncbi:MAG: thiolase family protein [Actinobacteria bacterium]|nr:thiolase family protein [Actinomycetota bacterium]